VTGRRFQLDASARRFVRAGATVLIGGSPLRLYRLTGAGSRLVGRIDAGEAVGDSALVDRLLDAGVIHPRPDSPGPYGLDDVTIVVPTLGQPTRVPRNAIVVDDGSVPPIAGATIRLERNRGPATARNAGLAAVTTPLVAFVDADVELPDGWLEPLLGHFADPKVAAVAPRVMTAARGNAISRYERGHGPLDMGSEPARVRAGTAVSYLPAAVLVCRAAAVRELGGFDPTMRYGEDVDLVWRLDEAGWRCRYDPSVVTLHEPRPDWGEWVRQRIGYGSSAGPLAVRHPGKLAPLHLSGWSLTGWLLVALGRPLAGIGVGVGSAAALIPKLPGVPPRAAFELAIRGNLRAGEAIAKSVRRTWLPLVGLLAMRSRAARRLALASLLAVRHPLTLADDAAYCVGVWRGMWRARTLDPIVPVITGWPGRTPRRKGGALPDRPGGA
jgi:mycofactocin system glycosyltransferase